MTNIYQQAISTFFGAAAITAAQADAVAKFPNESCGFIAGGAYVSCTNGAKDPASDFLINDPRYDAAVTAKTLQAVVHSHPNGKSPTPSVNDMTSQIATNVPWVIIVVNAKGIGNMCAWGGNTPIANLIGRPFLHGVFDCYSAVRDVYRLGKAGCATQSISWPLDPITLPEVPRDNNWWQSGTQDLYVDHLQPAGFVEIKLSDVKPGDGFLCVMGDKRVNPKQVMNHAGVVLNNEMILHHLVTRPCARTPASLWARAAKMWVRYDPVTAAAQMAAAKTATTSANPATAPKTP